jgi:hypothetical protein
MSQIILDISANTFKNDEAYYKRMIDELSAVDTRKHEVILKWQLFEESEFNIRARKALFVPLSEWAFKVHRYKTTSSVFDIESLRFLLECELPYDLPFIKIANNRKYDWLIGEIPRKYKVYKSVDRIPVINWQFNNGIEELWCVSEYPAPIEKYPDWCKTISDHTVGLELFHRNQPVIWEKHYKLSDSTGLDAGDFAITPEGLKEIL